MFLIETFLRVIAGEDEPGTVEAVAAVREDAIQPAIAVRGGLVKSMGDGFLLEFPSSVYFPSSVDMEWLGERTPNAFTRSTRLRSIDSDTERLRSRRNIAVDS